MYIEDIQSVRKSLRDALGVLRYVQSNSHLNSLDRRIETFAYYRLRTFYYIFLHLISVSHI